MIAAGVIKSFPVGATKGEVGRGGCPVHDAAELFALWIDDPEPAGAAAIDIAFDIDFHAVGNAGLGSTQIDKYAITGFGERAVRRDIKSPDVAAARIIDVEDALVRREGESVGH